jgi:predicted sulfurtransferase
MFLNSLAYKFTPIPQAELSAIRDALVVRAPKELHGTLLIAKEGINIRLSGPRAHVEAYQDELMGIFDGFAQMEFKQTASHGYTLPRFLVKIKKEIVSIGKQYESIKPTHLNYLNPSELKDWYQKQKDMIVLDTRNDYEIRLGAFTGALDLGIKSFRDFPTALAKSETLTPEAIGNKPVVMYCTGGIRCEKAVGAMVAQGFDAKQIFQLHGGIIKYLEHEGGAHYSGTMYTFDDRVALSAGLEQDTSVVQCFACRQPLTQKDQQSDWYKVGESCGYCRGQEASTESAAGSTTQRQAVKWEKHTQTGVVASEGIVCTLCGITLQTQRDWERHERGKKHRQKLKWSSDALSDGHSTLHRDGPNFPPFWPAMYPTVFKALGFRLSIARATR